MKNFKLNVIVRILVLAVSIFGLIFVYNNTELSATIFILSLLIIYQIYSLIKFIDTTNKELSRFFLSIKYSDFSQSFTRKDLGGSFKELNDAFNEVILQFQKTRSEKEEHLRYLQTVMQHVGVGLISYNQSGKVEFINNAAKKLLRIPHLRNIAQLDKVSGGLSKQILNITPGNKTTLKLVEENELLQLIVYSTEFKMRNQIYTLVSLQNIQTELEEKEMEAWQKLIRVLTHEIMNSVTPISSLAGTVNLMLSNGDKLDSDSVKDVRSAIGTIQKRSEGLIHFVENYRNLTKIPKPSFEIFPIKNIVERIDNLLGKELKNAGIEFTKSIHPEFLEITADAEMIEQVLLNLLLNAKHALKNTPNPKIDLVPYMDERGKVIIKVEDNGPGISEEVQEKIFIPFYTTKKDGSGIGLSLSRQIMRSHGGNIRVNSIVGKGSAFILRF